MSKEFYIDIPRLRGFLVVPNLQSMMFLGLPQLSKAVSSDTPAAWIREPHGWAQLQLLSIRAGVHLEYGELRSKDELVKSRLLLQSKGLIDGQLTNCFLGTVSELIEKLLEVTRDLNLEASIDAPRLSLWEKLRRHVFGIRDDGWKVVIMYIPSDLAVQFRTSEMDIPYVFMERKFDPKQGF